MKFMPLSNYSSWDALTPPKANLMYHENTNGITVFIHSFYQFEMSFFLPLIKKWNLETKEPSMVDKPSW